MSWKIFGRFFLNMAKKFHAKRQTRRSRITMNNCSSNSSAARLSIDSKVEATPQNENMLIQTTTLPQYLKEKQGNQEFFNIICATAIACIDISL